MTTHDTPFAVLADVLADIQNVCDENPDSSGIDHIETVLHLDGLTPAGKVRAIEDIAANYMDLGRGDLSYILNLVHRSAVRAALNGRTI